MILEQLNSQYPVPFTWNTFTSHVTFLDVIVRIDHGHFRTSVHIKPTNCQQYLHYNSSHPTSTKCSIPYSFATWGHRICNHPDDHHIYTSNLTRAFISHGYTVPLSHKRLFQGLHHPNPSQDPDHLFLITTYYTGLHRLKRILREGFHIISSDPSIQDLLTKPPLSPSENPQPLPTHCRYESPPPQNCHPHWLQTLQ